MALMGMSGPASSATSRAISPVIAPICLVAPAGIAPATAAANPATSRATAPPAAAEDPEHATTAGSLATSSEIARQLAAAAAA